MAPAEQAVKIAKLFVELVVARRTDRNHICRVARDPPIGKHSRNHERSEEIALSAFVDTEMRLEHFRRMHFLIAKPRFAENFGLERELHEILDPTSLQQNLWPFLVNGHTQVLLLREKDRVRFGRKREPTFLQQCA